MKKYSLVLVFVIILNSGCGTILGGKIADCQREKPAPGQPKRQIRPAALVGDLFSGAIPLAVDFIDGGIYKPCNKKNK